MRTVYAVHVLPINDEEEHEPWTGCWCQPIFMDGAWIHHAKDCRERFERQGIHDSNKPWEVEVEIREDPGEGG